MVEVAATGVSMAEQSMRRGRYPGQPKFPFVPGYDLVGTVTAVGPDVDPALIGTRVAAMTKTGGWASHAMLRAVDLVDVPDGLDAAEVETLIVNGVTAWQMLHRTARVRAGETVLVHGANGGVGTTLVQLAVHAGVRVVGTAHPRHHEALRSLGVDPGRLRRPGPPHDARGAGPGRGSTPSSTTSAGRAWTCPGSCSPRGTPGQLRHRHQGQGRRVGLGPFLATLGEGARLEPAAQRQARQLLQPVGRPPDPPGAPSGPASATDVSAVLALLADGTLTAQVAARFPLDQAVEAMTLAESRTVRGKVVLLP